MCCVYYVQVLSPDVVRCTVERTRKKNDPISSLLLLVQKCDARLLTLTLNFRYAKLRHDDLEKIKVTKKGTTLHNPPMLLAFQFVVLFLNRTIRLQMLPFVLVRRIFCHCYSERIAHVFFLPLICVPLCSAY